MAHFYGWTFAEIGSMTYREVRGAVEYRNKVMERQQAQQGR